MVDSVNSKTLATETAFSSCDAHNLRWVDDTGFEKVDILVARCIEAEVTFAFQYLGDNHAAIDGRVLRNLSKTGL